MTYDIATVSAAMEQRIRQLDHITHNLANEIGRASCRETV